MCFLLAVIACFSFTGCKKKSTAGSEAEFTEATPTDLTDSEEEPEEELKEKPDTTTASKEPTDKYKIVINQRTQVVTALSKDGSGKYTVPVRSMPCSTGVGGKTPNGDFKLGIKYRWQVLKGNVYGQWCSQVSGHILFHSVPYARKDPSSLITNYYNQLGGKASSGCIRLRAVDAKWIYDNCPSGTLISVGNFSESYLPGSIGVPRLPAGTGWDPSDPTPGNPIYGQTPTTKATTKAPVPTAAPTAAPTQTPTTKPPTTQPTTSTTQATTTTTAAP